MTAKNNIEWKGLTAGSSISKSLFIFHWCLLFFAVFLFIIGNWKLGIISEGVALLIAIISYRFAGGKRNPFIWKDKDLYDLLKHAALTGQARIGFHSLRDQKLLLIKLESIGVLKKPSKDTRHFIREKLVKDHSAFDICRDHIIIQTIHKGKEWFWNGNGKKRTAQYFH